MKIIGLTGFKGSGKNLAADQLPYWKQMSFASPLRAMLEAMGIEKEYLHEKKEYPIPVLETSARYLMQTLGTEWGRKTIDENLWVKVAMRYLDGWSEESHGENRPNIIFTDVRFPNEAKAIRDRGGVIVRIVRDGREGDGHESEQAMKLIDPDILIDNNGTPDALKCSMRWVADMYETIERKNK